MSANRMTRVRLSRATWALVLSGVGIERAAQADGIEGYALRGMFVLPYAGPWQQMFDARPDGRLLAAAGNDVYQETSPGSRRFEHLTALTGDGAPVDFPAFIKVQPDGARFAVGNNYGAVGIFDLAENSITWYFVDHFDAEWLDNVHLAIRAGGDVTLLDTTSDPNGPVNPLIMTNGPYSSGITFDAQGNLYTGTGFTLNGPSQTGWIKGFTRERWMGVLNGDPVIEYEEEGTLLADLLSAGSLGFDPHGNLHVGGADFETEDDLDYLGLVNGSAIADAWAGGEVVRRYDPDLRELDPDEAPFNFYDAAYNHALDELLVREASVADVHVYTLSAGIECDDVARFRATCGEGGNLRARVRLTDRTHSGTTAYLTLDGAAYRATVVGRKAAHRWSDLAHGTHTIALTDPAGCGNEVVVRCP